MRRVLLLSALPLAAGFFGTAAAQTTVSNERTTPLVTSTEGDITIDENGSLNLENQGQVGITVDSDNDVDVAGEINVSGEADNIGGILIQGTRTSNIDLSNAILVGSDATVTDEVPDDYPQGRYGILLATGGELTGNITMSDEADIILETDNGFAIGLEGNLTGNLNAAGSLVLAGDNSTLIETQSITGDLTINEAAVLDIDGVGSDGIVVNGDLGGAFRLGASLSVTGFTDLTPDLDDNEDNNNDFQEARPSGDGIRFLGDVGGGILLNGSVPESDLVEDTEAEPGQSFTSSSQVFGGGAALRLQGDVGDPSVIGAITNEDGLRSDYGTWSVENRGILSSSGLYDGFAGEAVVLENVDLIGGIRNSGTITANTQTEFATGVGLYGTDAPTLYTSGSIVATVNDGAGVATALHIDPTSSLPSLVNEGTLGSRSELGDAYSVLDESGTLTSITNTGSISTFSGLENPADDTIIAVDVRSNTTGVVFNNTLPDAAFDDDGTLLLPREGFGIVIGDVVFGSGNDQLSFDAGFLTGNVTFGAGDDVFTVSDGTNITGDVNFGTGFNTLQADNAVISGDLNFAASPGVLNLINGTEYNGALIDAGGVDVTLNASNATFADNTNTSLSSLSVENNSTLFVGISDDGSSIATFDVGGTFSVDETSNIDLVFNGFLEQEIEATIVSAGQLDISVEALNADLQETGSFIIDEQLTIDENNPNDLQLTLTRRSAEDLGIGEGVAPIYDSSLDALESDTELASALFSVSTEQEFDEAFEQLLPASLDMALHSAELQSTVISSLTGARSNLLIRDKSDPQGIIWAQQNFAFIDRDETEDVQAYRGQNFALAFGIDKPLLGLDVLGTAVSINSASLDEHEQEDLPNARVVWDFSTYAAKWIGKLALDGRFGYGLSQNSTKRRISIDEELREFSAKWEGTQLTGFARAQYPVNAGRFTFVPNTSLDWVSITEDEYTEINIDDSIALSADEREATSMYLNTGMTIALRAREPIGPAQQAANPFGGATRLGGQGRGHFTVSGGYSLELSDDLLSATYRYGDGDPFELTSERLGDRFYAGTDFNYTDDIFVFSAGLYTHFGESSRVLSGRVSLGVQW